MKRLLAYAIVILATLTGLLLLWQIRLVVGIFLLSLLVSAAVRPVIERITARGLPMVAAMLLTYLSGLLLLALAGYFFSGPLVGEVDMLADRLTVTYDILYPNWEEGSAFEQALAGRLPPPQQLYDLIAAEEGQLLAQTVFAFTQSLISFLSGFALILVLSVYWSTDQAHFERLWLSLLSPEQRGRGRKIWRALEVGVGRYIRNEGALSLIAFFLLLLVYALAGINYPIILATLGAFAWLIPIVGFIFTIIPAFLASLPLGLGVALAVSLYTMLVLLALEFVIQPRLFHRRRAYSPILVILLFIPLASLYGLVGLLVAPPLAVAIQILLSSLFRRRRLEVDAVYPSARVLALEQKLAALRETAGTPQPEIKSMMDRLEELLTKAGDQVDQIPLSPLENATSGLPAGFVEASEEQGKPAT